MDSFHARDIQRLFGFRDAGRFNAVFEYVMKQSGEALREYVARHAPEQITEAMNAVVDQGEGASVETKSARSDFAHDPSDLLEISASEAEGCESPEGKGSTWTKDGVYSGLRSMNRRFGGRRRQEGP